MPPISPSYLLIFICLASGYVLGANKTFPAGSHKVLNHFVVWISLPALVLTQIPALLHHTQFSWADFLIPGSMAWIQFGIALFLLSALARSMKWNTKQTGALVMTAGLGNTSFVGFPLLEALVGERAIPIGVIVDQAGSFLALSILGVSYAAAKSPLQKKGHSIRDTALKVICFPAFIALFFCLLIHGAGLEFPVTLNVSLEKLASTLVPLALFSVGLQLNFKLVSLRENVHLVSAGLLFKLILMPLLFSTVYLAVLKLNSLTVQVTILESAMAPMITGAIVADEFGFDADVSSLMLGIGIPLSLFTVPLWNWLLF